MAPTPPSHQRYFTRSSAKQKAAVGIDKVNRIQSEAMRLPMLHMEINKPDIVMPRKRKRSGVVVDDDELIGPKNIFELNYYDPRAPGSFSGVRALQRRVKGVKSNKQVQEWLQSQPTYTLHKPVRKRFRRNMFVVNGVDEQFQADLADVSMLADENDGVTFLLVVIDVFSKYMWIIPLRNKRAETVAEAFRMVFKERVPKQLMTDSGAEFENKHVREVMRAHGVHHFFAWDPVIKAPVVERVIRTVKGRIWKILTYKKTRRYIPHLTSVNHSYNNTPHRSIKMTPVEASDPANT